jgi:sulfur transfer complex TusBCD TusB component (DsrH family)
MVEKTIKKYSQEYGKYGLWKKLPKKMMYQTFKTILDYLEESGKIMICKDGIIIWTYDPKMVNRLISKGLVMR